MIIIENNLNIPDEILSKCDLTELNKSIELHINQQLYDKKHITSEMYERAKQMIISEK